YGRGCKFNCEFCSIRAFYGSCLRQRPVADWYAAFDAAGVPSGPINDFAAVFNDPQVRHRALRQDLPHPTLGSVPIVANPVHFSATPVAYDRAPPLVGEHTDEVLREVLGADDARLQALRRAGAL
ncbi:MAG: CoA transferase, partial [Rhodoferax sp.]|nr:CoA transferase [Rhodoferax sp.]